MTFFNNQKYEYILTRNIVIHVYITVPMIVGGGGSQVLNLYHGLIQDII